MFQQSLCVLYCISSLQYLHGAPGSTEQWLKTLVSYSYRWHYRSYVICCSYITFFSVSIQLQDVTNQHTMHLNKLELHSHTAKQVLLSQCTVYTDHRQHTVCVSTCHIIMSCKITTGRFVHTLSPSHMKSYLVVPSVKQR